MKELRLVLLGLAAIVAVLLGASFVTRALTHNAPQETALVTPRESPPAAPTSDDPTPPRAAVTRALAETPEYSRFFERLRSSFPDDYASILNGAATADKPATLNADLLMSDAVVALRRAHGGLAAKAPDGALEEIFKLQLREMQALAQSNPQLCVAFLYGASGRGFLGFAASHRALITDAALAGLEAMNGGRSNPVSRATPSDDDFQALDRALEDKGLSRAEIDALLDGKTADPPIADPEMCKAGQTYLETLATMPADARARLYGLAVDLMAKS